MDLTELLTVEGKQPHTIIEKGLVWYSADDVCKAFGYNNPREAIKHNMYSGYISKFCIQQRKRNYILDAGVAVLAFNSRKPKAQAFAQKIRDVFLPEEYNRQLAKAPIKYSQYLRKLADEAENVEKTL
jgi:prophage antirepressor-like protein